MLTRGSSVGVECSRPGHGLLCPRLPLCRVTLDKVCGFWDPCFYFSGDRTAMRVWGFHTVSLRAEISSTWLFSASRPLLVQASGSHSYHSAIWAKSTQASPFLLPSHSGHPVFAELLCVRHRAGARVSDLTLQGRQVLRGSHQIKPTPETT